jgi:hypothetical protein
MAISTKGKKGKKKGKEVKAKVEELKRVKGKKGKKKEKEVVRESKKKSGKNKRATDNISTVTGQQLFLKVHTSVKVDRSHKPTDAAFFGENGIVVPRYKITAIIGDTLYFETLQFIGTISSVEEKAPGKLVYSTKESGNVMIGDPSAVYLTTPISAETQEESEDDEDGEESEDDDDESEDDEDDSDDNDDESEDDEDGEESEDDDDESEDDEDGEESEDDDEEELF